LSPGEPASWETPWLQLGSAAEPGIPDPTRKAYPEPSRDP